MLPGQVGDYLVAWSMGIAVSSGKREEDIYPRVPGLLTEAAGRRDLDAYFVLSMLCTHSFHHSFFRQRYAEHLRVWSTDLAPQDTTVSNGNIHGTGIKGLKYTRTSSSFCWI